MHKLEICGWFRAFEVQIDAFLPDSITTLLRMHGGHWSSVFEMVVEMN
jgi:hypothetical protein